MVAVRTTSHAFATRDGQDPEGRASWPTFDREVLGGTYTGHHGNHPENGDPPTLVWMTPENAQHPILTGIPPTEFVAASWLYKMSPLSENATPLMMGRVGDRKPIEPVAWTHNSPSGGRVFYTSLGHEGDFRLPQFVRLLKNAIYWAAELSVTSSRKDDPVSGEKSAE
jgi:type 1 glutamine amidotransferase